MNTGEQDKARAIRSKMIPKLSIHVSVTVSKLTEVGGWGTWDGGVQVGV